MTRVLITGSAGFIGYHLARLLLAEGCVVHGYDGMTDYYDIRLKQRRHALLLHQPGFSCTIGLLEDQALFDATADSFAPDIIVHLAAQAGVRYSLQAPGAYLQANVIGTLSVLEAARRLQVRHLMIASTSSIYGANEKMPFSESDTADLPLTIYAASKKATEGMGHVYAHLWGLPVTCFRFFTVYGPWGRPDMALFRFTAAILDGQPIDIYNHGNMARDFTYVGDLVRAIRLLMDVVPSNPAERPVDSVTPAADSLSPIAPWRVVNIGNSTPVPLLDFIAAIEACLGRKAVRNYTDMQPGDVSATWADATLLQQLTGYSPQTDVRDGIARFVDWYRDYYGK
jgi:UDP-glucuronate 4-epimerase